VTRVAWTSNETSDGTGDLTGAAGSRQQAAAQGSDETAFNRRRQRTND